MFQFLLHTLTLESLDKLTSVEVLSGCAALHTLTLSHLFSLTSVEVLMTEQCICELSHQNFST